MHILYYISLLSYMACVIDTISNLVFWSFLVNKLELWHIVYIMQQITIPSDINLIDRLQFPWLTASRCSLVWTSKISSSLRQNKKVIENDWRELVAFVSLGDQFIVVLPSTEDSESNKTIKVILSPFYWLFQ